MKTITFKELIELIEQDKAPKRIRVNEETFNHEGNGQYFSYRGSPLFSLYNLQELINDYYIEIPTEPLLTDEEKAYLKAVIEPVKEDVFSIRRQSGTLYIHISVTATMTFNLKTFIYKFSGLKEEKSYKLSDLDLE